ncbi:hypothetical protein MBLNU230_g2406t1 [Neophaeotheca triangularis]
MADLIICEAVQEGIRAFTGHTFTDLDLIWKAINQRHVPGSINHNNRLALLGDSVIKTVLLLEWMPSAATTATASNEVSGVLSNANLARAGRYAGFSNWIVPADRHDEMFGLSDKKLATAVEALLGAIYLDSGLNVAAVKKAMQGFHLVPN